MVGGFDEFGSGHVSLAEWVDANSPLLTGQICTEQRRTCRETEGYTDSRTGRLDKRIERHPENSIGRDPRRIEVHPDNRSSRGTKGEIDRRARRGTDH